MVARRRSREENLEIFRELAWRDFIMWVVTQPGIRAQFQEDTHIAFPSKPTTTIDAMIDKACGYDAKEEWEKAGEAFVLWVTERRWGIDEAPLKVRLKLEKEKKNGIGKDRT